MTDSLFHFGIGVYVLGFITGFLAGFVDSIGGGGGLVALPVLIHFGLDPVTALGTNKLQATFGTFTSISTHIKNKTFHAEDVWLGVMFTFIGAATGTILVKMIVTDFLSKIIPVMLFIILLYIVFRKDYTQSKPKLPLRTTYIIFGLLLGFYDGFFGPGTGAFWTTVFLLLSGFTITKAIANTKIMNFISNAVSLAVFAYGAKIEVVLGICMGMGQIWGAYMGSKLAIKKGVSVIRPIIMIVALLMIIKMIYENWF